MLLLPSLRPADSADDDTAADGQSPTPHLLHTGRLPHRDHVAERMPPPELLDARAEEPARLVPPVAGDQASGRQANPCPRPPRAVPRAIRHEELERGDGAAGADNARKFAERGLRV